MSAYDDGMGREHGERRPRAIHPVPAHTLSQAERAKIPGIADEAHFGVPPPARVVPMPADEEVYLDSPSRRRL